jgi:hypothetical protein
MNATGFEGDVLVDNLSDSVEAIEAELGVDPAGGASTVKARLDLTALGHVQPTMWPTTGHRYTTNPSGQGGTGNAVTVDRLYYVPFFCPTSVTIAALAIRCTAAAGTNTRLGIYSDTFGSDGHKPSALIVDAGTVLTSGTGVKECAVSQALTAHTLYWLACVSDAGPSLDSCPATSHGWTATRDSSGNFATGLCYESFTYGALPSNAGTLTRNIGATGTTIIPQIWVVL